MLVSLLACGGSGTNLTPDVPRWRGGCFLSGPAGKIVNAFPSPDVQLFGTACAEPAGPGGLVYLDRYDPISGSGDVTVLSAARDSAPVVIARNGGGGSVVIGSTGARFDDPQERVVTLANLSFVTGDLVMASLPAGTPLKTIAKNVRVGNYEFLADGGALFVGNYDAAARQGDLLYWNDGEQLVATAASRFDFVMYRLAPDRAKVAYLRGYTDAAGGDLFVQPLPPGPEPTVPLASTVYRMAWTADGQRLVFRTRNADGVTFGLWVWDGAGAPRSIAPEVNSASLVGNAVLYTTGWSVLEQRATLHLVPAAGGPDALDGTGPASLVISASQPAGTSGALAYVALPSATVASSGDLFLSPIAPLAPVRVDAAVSTTAGYGVSPGAGFVSYAVGFDDQQAPGSANPQPGIADQLKVAGVGGGPPFLLAQDASTFVAWDPRDRFVSAVGSFEPALNRGQLVVRSTTDGGELFSAPDVGNGAFGFAPDGSFLWALRAWDDALRRGELVFVPTSGGGAWQATPIDSGVTCVAAAAAGRAVYCAHGNGRDGLWLGAAP